MNKFFFSEPHVHVFALWEESRGENPHRQKQRMYFHTERTKTSPCCAHCYYYHCNYEYVYFSLCLYCMFCLQITQMRNTAIHVVRVLLFYVCFVLQMLC